MPKEKALVVFGLLTAAVLLTITLAVMLIAGTLLGHQLPDALVVALLPCINGLFVMAIQLCKSAQR